MSTVDREGNFKCIIEDYGVKEPNGGGLIVSISCLCTHWLDPDGNWLEWTEYDQHVSGDLWAVGQDGKVDDRCQKRIDDLIRCAGWDGSFASIVNRTWAPTPCQVWVKKPTKQDGTAKTFKDGSPVPLAIVKISPLDHVPAAAGAIVSIDGNRAKQFDSMYGATIRALKGTAARSTVPPAATPPKDPPKPKKPVPQNVPTQSLAEIENDSVPF